MNIFAIDRDPTIAAKHMVDSHVVKMVLESAQMLANCFSNEMLASPACPRTAKGEVRKHSYYNHPCSIWTRSSRQNMRWLCEHAIAADLERLSRAHLKRIAQIRLMLLGLPYDKDVVERVPSTHFCLPFIYWALSNINLSVAPDVPLTEFAQAMPEQFKCEDSVEAYRNLYRVGKAHLHSWTRNKPDWL